MINTFDLARMNKIARFCYREGAQFTIVYHKKSKHWDFKLQKGARPLTIACDTELTNAIRQVSDWIDEQ